MRSWRSVGFSHSSPSRRGGSLLGGHSSWGCRWVPGGAQRVTHPCGQATHVTAFLSSRPLASLELQPRYLDGPVGVQGRIHSTAAYTHNSWDFVCSQYDQGFFWHLLYIRHRVGGYLRHEPSYRAIHWAGIPKPWRGIFPTLPIREISVRLSGLTSERWAFTFPSHRACHRNLAHEACCHRANGLGSMLSGGARALRRRQARVT